MANLKVEYISVSKVTPYEHNTRTHSESQIEQIAESIREFGFTKPILIDQANVLIAGHGALLAAQLVGLSEIPCIRLSHLSDRQRRAYIIADNKIAQNSGWDFEKLGEELAYLASTDYDLEITGFSEDELDALLKSDKDLLPKDFIEPETVTVAAHERNVNQDKKVKPVSWSVVLEAKSKSDAKEKLAALMELGYIGVILKNGES